MVVYIVGMITGAVCLVFPLIYVMNFDRAVARILSRNPEFPIESFTPHISSGLLYIVSLIGAAVLLVCTLMAAIIGASQLRARRKLQPAVPELAGEPLDLSASDDA